MKTFEAKNEAYPLHWPAGFERTAGHKRSVAKFGARGRGVSVALGVELVQDELKRFSGRAYAKRISDVVISTNLQLRLDGLPYSNQKEPNDTGVAVYFTMDRKPTVLCCDKWHRVGDNLAAIAKTMEAMRGMERWGVTETERVFTGFAALPAPGDVQAKTCWVVLGIAPTHDLEAIKKAWKEKAAEVHPDKQGGDHNAMAEVNEARDQAVKYAEAKN